MRIQHNIPSMNAYRNYNNNSGRLSNNLEKLSSGYRINRAGDDAAGLAISEKMRAQISGLEVAQKNAKDGISLVQTAEGALTEVQDMLNRMYSLAEQSANGTYDESVDRAQLQKEVESLRQEIDRIGDSANFNGIKLLDGSMSAGAGEVMITATSGNDLISADDVTTGVTFSTSLSDSDKAKVISALSKVSLSVNSEVASGATAVTYSGETASLTGNDYAIGSVTVASNVLTLELTDDQGATVATVTATMVASAATAAATTSGTISFSFAKAGVMQLQVGDTPDDYNKLGVSVDSVKTDQLGKYDVTTTTVNGVGISYKTLATGADSIADIDISTQQGAADALDVIKNAINYVSDSRGGLGAIQNRLDHTINNLSVMQENMQDAESTIRDTDVADEMMKYTKNNILVQSAQAMLAQANQIPQGVLQLLQ